ncbi:MAG: hypothetical protein JWP85_2449 [Rhodoglobus sp.]|nr:hypothetical protein [Rhodoglobus sp.]
MLGFQQSLFRMETQQHQRDVDVAFIRRRLQAVLERERAERDDIAGLTEFLVALRQTPEYSAAMSQAEPLVSVRIASYARTQELMEVAIPSVLAQTYQNFELIIVNDGPNENTRRAVERLNDPRVHYEEFPARHSYPEDAHARWMVAGSPGMNRGADLAKGTWIAPLDEDDSFAPDHIEKLLKLAHSREVELAYGALRQINLANGDEKLIWSYPPAISQFSFQGAIYLRLLNGGFRYDQASWLVEEPGDWNLIRRMRLAGVTMAATEDVVGIMNQVPYTHKPVD